MSWSSCFLCSKSVNLCVFCQKYPNKELHADGKESLWDARRGFTVPSHLISYAGVVSCQTHIGNETFKSPLYIVAVVGKSYLFFFLFFWTKWILCIRMATSKCRVLLVCGGNRWKLGVRESRCGGTVCSLMRTIGRQLTPGVCPPFSAGYKIYDLTLTPAQTRLSAGERLALSCTATTELNVGIEFNWTHSGLALVSTLALLQLISWMN